MKKLLFTMFLGTILAACSKEDALPPSGDYNNYDQVIDEGGPMPEPPAPSQVVLSTSLADELQGEELWRCSTERLQVGYHSGGQNGFPQFNPNASVIYPGSLLQGKSLNQATPDVIAVERAGGTISIDILDGSQQSTFEVDKVTKSSITDASNAIIAASTGAIPANMEFSYERIQSKEQMAASLKLDYHNAFTEVEAKLKFSSDKEYNRTIVNLTQSYYTMSYDIPTSLDQVFDPDVTPQDLAKYIGPGNPATYISDVTYGRIYMLLIETTSSEIEMDAAVNASFNGVVSGGGVDAKVNYLASLESLKVKLFAFGGEAASTLLTIGNAGDLSVLTQLLAEGTDIRTGKPISYVVRSVYNNQIVKVGLNTEYDVTNCEPINPNGPPPVQFAHWTGLLLTFGPIGAATTLDGKDKIMLVNQQGTHYLISHNGAFEGPFHINDLGTEPCPFARIGSAAYVAEAGYDDALMVFDDRGLNYAYYDINHGTWSSVSAIADWGNGLFPFSLEGVSAVMNHGLWENGFTPDPNDYSEAVSFIKANSAAYALYLGQNWGGWPSHIGGLVLGFSDFPFESVAAATEFKLGQYTYWLFFDEPGDRYVILVEDWEDYFTPPYGI